mmetsp:Transcript_32037/g.64338  ORF Transcript_32037/g.64338 Transcript_32037/m.64338 type:complete len:616 (-) Transcript_32037:223-2070(-)
MPSPFVEQQQNKNHDESPSGGAVAAEDLHPHSQTSDPIDDHVDVQDPVTVGQMYYDALDPLDTRRYAFDTLELYSHEMLMTGDVSRRAFLIEKTRFIMVRLIGAQYDWGRLYNRSTIANMVGRVNARYAYELPSDENIYGGPAFKLQDCLVDLTPDKWAKLIGQFEAVRNSLLRRDASAIVLPSEIDINGEEVEEEDSSPGNDPTIDDKFANRIEFNEDFENMMDTLKFNMCLSHIQPHLHNAVENDVREVESVAVPPEHIASFRNAIEENFSDSDEKGSMYKAILEELLIIRRTRDREGVYLRTLDEIKKVHRKHFREFDLERFQTKFLKLIRRWTELVLPLPVLSKLKYGVPRGNDYEVDAEYENLSSDRKPASKNNSPNIANTGNRQQNHEGKHADHPVSPAAPSNLEESFTNEANDDIESFGDSSEDGAPSPTSHLKVQTEKLKERTNDPLSECLAKANAAPQPREKRLEGTEDDEDSDSIRAGPKQGQLYAKKKSRKQLTFEDDTEDGDDDDGGVELSSVPKRVEVNKASKNQSPPLREVNASPASTKGQKKRKRFTEIEDAAIKNGIKHFGDGKWAAIKAHYAVQLKDRTSVQIKDRVRTLRQNGELEE